MEIRWSIYSCTSGGGTGSVLLAACSRMFKIGPWASWHRSIPRKSSTRSRHAASCGRFLNRSWLTATSCRDKDQKVMLIWQSQCWEHWQQVSGPFPKLHMRPRAVRPASRPKGTMMTPHPGRKQDRAPASARLETCSVIVILGKLRVSVCLMGVAIRGVLPTNAALLVKFTPASASPVP